MGQYIQTYASDCTVKIETKWRDFDSSCEYYPTNTTNYFDALAYFNETNNDPYEGGQYAGYNTSGYGFNSSVCFIRDNSMFDNCTVLNEEFYAATKINSNNWNMYSPAYAGTFGFGAGSSVWDIINNPSSKNFDIYMSPMADYSYLSYYQADAITESGVMNFGSCGNYSFNDVAITHTYPVTALPYKSGSYLFEMDYLTFGITNTTVEDSETQYYESIINDFGAGNDYEFWTNTSMFTMNFRGLGLPADSYLLFSNLLAVLVKGQSECIQKKGGFCVLTNPCDYYTDLWEYSFRVKFPNDDYYLEIPLAMFAAP